MDDRIENYNVQISGEHTEVHLGPKVVVNGDLETVNIFHIFNGAYASGLSALRSRSCRNKCISLLAILATIAVASFVIVAGEIFKT